MGQEDNTQKYKHEVDAYPLYMLTGKNYSNGGKSRKYSAVSYVVLMLPMKLQLSTLENHTISWTYRYFDQSPIDLLCEKIACKMISHDGSSRETH